MDRVSLRRIEVRPSRYASRLQRRRTRASSSPWAVPVWGRSSRLPDTPGLCVLPSPRRGTETAVTTAELGPGAEAGVTATRWRRYGHDRLYVKAPDGSQLGYRDLSTGLITWNCPSTKRSWQMSRTHGRRSKMSPLPAVSRSRDLARPLASLRKRLSFHGLTSPSIVPAPQPASRRWLGVPRHQSRPRWRACSASTPTNAPGGSEQMEKNWWPNSWPNWQSGTRCGRQSTRSLSAGEAPTSTILSWVLAESSRSIPSVTRTHRSGCAETHSWSTARERCMSAMHVTKPCVLPGSWSWLLAVSVHVEALIVPVLSNVPTIKSQPGNGVRVVSRRRVADWLLGLGTVLATEQLNVIWEHARRSTTWEE